MTVLLAEWTKGVASRLTIRGLGCEEAKLLAVTFSARFWEHVVFGRAGLQIGRPTS